MPFYILCLIAVEVINIDELKMLSDIKSAGAWFVGKFASIILDKFDQLSSDKGNVNSSYIFVPIFDMIDKKYIFDLRNKIDFVFEKYRGNI